MFILSNNIVLNLFDIKLVEEKTGKEVLLCVQRDVVQYLWKNATSCFWN